MSSSPPELPHRDHDHDEDHGVCVISDGGGSQVSGGGGREQEAAPQPGDLGLPTQTAPSSSHPSPPYRVSVSGSAGYVWEPETVMALRINHRIVGALIGTLARLPTQNMFLSLPLLLLPEEVTLLLEEGLIHLINDSKAHTHPTPDQTALFLQQTQLQTHEYEEARKQFALATKKKKARRSFESSSISGNPEVSGEYVTEAEPPIEDPPLLPVSTPCSSQSLPWYNPPTTAGTGEEAGSESLWTWPSTDFEKLKYRVFRSLWRDGYYISSGSKFGGDYLLYE
ncbi:tRNA-splicing endonuclease subunit, partial [Quaeritorhiza haematococci]